MATITGKRDPDGPGPPVCILGLGRSGTSLAARAVNLLGVDLGPTDAMPVVPEGNPAGQWEQADINHLNDAILEIFGGDYWDPPPLPDGWQRDARLDPLRTRIAELVAALYPAGARWGFKDPRTALTLPVWRDVVGPMVYVLCVRNPLEVAASHRVADTEHNQEPRALLRVLAARERGGAAPDARTSASSGDLPGVVRRSGEGRAEAASNLKSLVSAKSVGARARRSRGSAGAPSPKGDWAAAARAA